MNSCYPSRHFLVSACILAFAVFSLVRCDVPTEGPSFKFNTSMQSRMIMDRSFVLMGSDASDAEPLIDSSGTGIDTLLRTSGPGDTLRIVEEFSAFDEVSLDNALPDVSIDPVTASASIGDLAQQDFSGSFTKEIGPIRVTQSQTLTPSQQALAFNNSRLEAPTVPTIPLAIQLDQNPPDPVDYVVHNSEGTNEVTITVRNNSSTDLTLNGGAPVLKIMRGSTEEVASKSFADAAGVGTNGAIPSDGSAVSITLSLDGLTLQGQDDGEVYVIDQDQITSGNATEAQDVTVEVTTSTLQFTELQANEEIGQNRLALDPIDVSQTGVGLSGSDDFEGLIVDSGTLSLELVNNQPMTLNFTQIEIINQNTVSGNLESQVFTTSDIQGDTEVGPNSSQTVTVDLAGASISNLLDVNATADVQSLSAGSPVTSSGEIGMNMSGTVDISTLYLQPHGEMFSTGGSFSVPSDKVEFLGPNQFIELESGSLDLSNVTNELGVNMDSVLISIPAIRTSSSPADSLVILFEGNTTDAANYHFPAIDANESGRNVPTISLDGLRIYPTNNEIEYHIRAVSEDVNQTRTINISDQISASLEVGNLSPSRVRAAVVPLSVNVTDDANSDGRLDVGVDNEAQVQRISSMEEIANRVEGLEFADMELGINLTTDMAVDFALYMAMLGRSSAGNEVFLTGSGAFDVPSSDTVAQSFYQNGTVIPSDDLIRFDVPGAPSVGSTVTRSVMLTPSNSNITSFINNLPTEIRMAGKALVNPSGQVVDIQQPISLTPALTVQLPLAIGGGGFTFRDTMEADLSDLEGQTQTDSGEPVRFTGGSLIFNYTNGFPIGVNAEFRFLDQSYNPIGVTIPGSDQDDFLLDPAQVNQSGFAVQSRSGRTEISLSEDQIKELSKARHVELQIQVTTGSNSDNARFRAVDRISLSLTGRFEAEVNVGE